MSTDRGTALTSCGRVRAFDNGALLVQETLVTPEDAVRMLIRTMGQDPESETFRDVPADIVRQLRSMRRNDGSD